MNYSFIVTDVVDLDVRWFNFCVFCINLPGKGGSHRLGLTCDKLSCVEFSLVLILDLSTPHSQQ